MKSGDQAMAVGRPMAAHPELWPLVALLALANLPLLSGRPSEALIFLPGRVAAGEWWRVLTCPLAHVSWYHLLLDGAAFVQLLMSLGELGLGRRLLVILGAGAGSVLLPLAWPSPIREVGICGLSGIDHGMMAVAGALMLGEKERAARRQGGCLLAFVTLKAIVEAATGRILLESLHVGFLGVPVACCHLGGVLGALIVFGALRALRRSNTVAARAPALATASRA